MRTFPVHDNVAARRRSTTESSRRGHDAAAVTLLRMPAPASAILVTGASRGFGRAVALEVGQIVGRRVIQAPRSIFHRHPHFFSDSPCNIYYVSGVRVTLPAPVATGGGPAVEAWRRRLPARAGGPRRGGPGRDGRRRAAGRTR
jgi:hypothetical protein